jgi:exodeoxyribonuclease V alpha subunit
VPDLSDAPGADAAGAVVVEDASRLGLDDAADLLSRLLAADGEPRLLLVGDPSLPYAPGPGRVLADVVASGVVPVDTAATGSGDAGTGGQLAALVRSLRAGVLPAVDPSRREVVVTPADDPDQAVRRAVQLVTSSVPRAFELAGPDVLVLAPRRGGRAGAEALRAALDAAGAGDVRTATADAAATQAAEAVVLVLAAESAGSITRSLLVGAATRAGRHLSVVHQAGPALMDAVAHRPHPPRRTRLATLLADALG